MNVSQVGAVLGILVALVALFGALAKVGQFVLTSFHNEHVQPAIAQVSAAIERNTTSTESVAAALVRSDAARASHEDETGRTFERMGQIIEDHERRITQLEPRRRTGT